MLVLKSMLSINEQHQAVLISSCHLTEGLYLHSYQGRDYSAVVCFNYVVSAGKDPTAPNRVKTFLSCEAKLSYIMNSIVGRAVHPFSTVALDSCLL